MTAFKLATGIFLTVFFNGIVDTDPCSEAAAGVFKTNTLSKNIVFTTAVKNIQAAFKTNGKEHAVVLAKDSSSIVYSSAIAEGGMNSGTLPLIAGAFADIHNHTGNLPPDAGDLYGLLDISRHHPDYNTRFIITANGTLYALLVTDTAAAKIFDKKYPRQPPAYAGVQPSFPVKLVDEFREIKYRYHTADETALAFILEKYRAGVSLLKQDPGGEFKKLRTVVSGNEGSWVFHESNCP